MPGTLMIGSLPTVPSVSRVPPGLQLTNGTGTTTSSTARPTKTSAETKAVQVCRVTGAAQSASGRPTHWVSPETNSCSFQIGTSALRVSIRCVQAASASPRWTAPVATTTARSPTSRWPTRCCDGDGDHVVLLGRLLGAPTQRLLGAPGGGCSPGRPRPRRRSWSRITPTKIAIPPTVGSETRPSSRSTLSGDSVMLASRTVHDMCSTLTEGVRHVPRAFAL